MDTVDVKVIIRTARGDTVSDEETNVRLNDDDVTIAAGNLAYGLVEDVWGLLVKEDEN